MFSDLFHPQAKYLLGQLVEIRRDKVDMPKRYLAIHGRRWVNAGRRSERGWIYRGSTFQMVADGLVPVTLDISYDERLLEQIHAR